MKDPVRLIDRLDHMLNAVVLACSYVEGLQKQDFVDDKRTQQAVILNILVIGEAATQLSNDFPDFVAQHPAIPWAAMRGMRNRMAHGYFDIDLDVVWDTVQSSLPELQGKLEALVPSLRGPTSNP